MRTACEVPVGKTVKEKTTSEIHTNEKIILKWVLRIQDMRVWTGLS